MITHKDMTIPKYDELFVFGSNLAGIHGAGAAAYAHQQYHAKLGVGVGPSGRCYAIPTKDEKIRSMELEDIKPYVDQFIEHVLSNDNKYFITRVGCGLAGNSDKDMSLMFERLWENERCSFPEEWQM